MTGIRFALEPGAGRSAAPVRSAILGGLLAVVVVTATVTFGASLDTLVSHPPLYGWNWTYEINGGGGLGDIPTAQAGPLLDHDRDVAAWSGVYFGTLSIGGENVPVLGTTPGAAVAPPVLSGTALRAPDQIVMGAATLAGLHEHVGNWVTVSAPGSAPVRLRIVGTATLPAIGIGGINHLEMGTGAVVSHTLIPVSQTNLFDLPVAGPNAILVRTTPEAGRCRGRGVAPARHRHARAPGQRRPGAGGAASRRDQRLSLSRRHPRPARRGPAAGAVGGLGITLVASVRRRRRALALLKTLGFTTRQLAASVSWQSTVAVGIGTVIGVPLGIVVGRGRGTCSWARSTPCPARACRRGGRISGASPRAPSCSPTWWRRCRGSSCAHRHGGAAAGRVTRRTRRPPTRRKLDATKMSASHPWIGQ